MNIWLDHQRFAFVPFGNHFSNFHCRAFAQVVNVGLKCQTKAGDFQLAGALAALCQTIRYRGFDLVEYPVRFAVVHFTRGADQTSLCRILRHDKPRVDGDAVSTHARAWLENIDTRMAIRQANQLPDVNPLIGADQ